MTTKKTNRAVGVGTAVAVSLAAIAGAVYLYGKDGAKHRKQVKGWMLKARGEVLDRLEKVGDWNEETYQRVIDQVAAKYRGVKNIDKEELAALVLDLKRHWNNISRQLKSTTAPKSRPKSKPRTSKSTTQATK